MGLGDDVALILDDGSTIVDSFVITEYLDDLAGGGKLFPAIGPDKWKRKTEHSIIQGMLEAMLLCRYEKMLRPEELRWQTWLDDQWDRAWQGFSLFEQKPETKIGQALYEQVCYDRETGQLLTGSLLDYTVPRADSLPAFRSQFQETPSPTNPLGVKGIGESGSIGAPPTIVHAVLDALAPFGIADQPVQCPGIR